MFKRFVVVAIASLVAFGGIGATAAHANHNDSYLEEHVVEPVVGALAYTGYYLADYLADGAEEFHEELAEEWYDHGGGYLEHKAAFVLWSAIFAGYWTYNQVGDFCPELHLDNFPLTPGGDVLTVPLGLCLLGGLSD